MVEIVRTCFVSLVALKSSLHLTSATKTARSSAKCQLCFFPQTLSKTLLSFLGLINYKHIFNVSASS